MPRYTEYQALNIKTKLLILQIVGHAIILFAWVKNGRSEVHMYYYLSLRRIDGKGLMLS